MESRTFRTWLAQHGCTFDGGEQKRGQGHAVVTVHREGRTAELPMVGSHKPVDAEIARRICVDLNLNPKELPGPSSRV
jgi:hypothetical protein